MTNYFARLHRHKDNPAMGHLQSFLTDVISTLEDFENHIVQRVATIMAQAIQEGKKDMSDIVDQLTKTVQDLSDKATAHDTEVQSALANLKTGMSAGDQTAIQAAIGAIAAASGKIATDTAAVAAAIPAAVAAAPPTAATPAAPTV